MKKRTEVVEFIPSPFQKKVAMLMSEIPLEMAQDKNLKKHLELYFYVNHFELLIGRYTFKSLFDNQILISNINVIIYENELINLNHSFETVNGDIICFSEKQKNKDCLTIINNKINELTFFLKAKLEQKLKESSNKYRIKM